MDKYDRVIRKLRLSVTDRCNLRCRYCMPLSAQFMDRSAYLQPREYAEIVKELAQLGITTVRLTGGEPLVRQEFPEIVSLLAKIPDLEISLTTNGIFLEQFLDLLKGCNVRTLNISLDSLTQENFYRIAHTHQLEPITRSIEQAVDQDFRVKLNMVVMGHYNDQEIVAMVEYGHKLGVEVRFLELMQIGYARHLPPETFISAQELLSRLQNHYDLIPISSPPDSTAVRYQTPSGGTIGFIASESQPFCGHCSRWRLSADGTLRACLFREEGISLRGLNREQRQLAYGQVLGMKPLVRASVVGHPMYQIGG